MRRARTTEKAGIKRLPGMERVRGMYHRLRQNRIIEAEQAHYEEQARARGLTEPSDSGQIQADLQERLARRGVAPRPKADGKLHLVYATPDRSWDVINIPPGFIRFSDVTTYLLPEHGFDSRSPSWVDERDQMNEHFVEFVTRLHARKPVDMVLTYFSGHHVGPGTIHRINELGIVTAAFHLDDRVSFRGKWLGGRWRGPAAVTAAYDLNLTQAPESLVKYRVEGGIPMLWALAANPELCWPRDGSFRYDVSFAGTAYGNRISLVRYLREHGVEVATFGNGWPGGYLEPDEFQAIYSSSRINLNSDDIGYTRYQCGKLRDFELPMCGCLMLSTGNPHLGKYFEIGSEVFTFDTPADCLRQIRRLLADEEVCARARIRARERALKEHTWEHRARELLKVIGFL